MTAQELELGKAGGSREQWRIWSSLEGRGRRGKSPFASGATVHVSIARREIPILNCSASKSARSLFSALVRRHATICLADMKEHFSLETNQCRAWGGGRRAADVQITQAKGQLLFDSRGMIVSRWLTGCLPLL